MRTEYGAIEAGAVERDPFARDAQRGHVVGQPGGYGQQAVGVVPGPKHLGRCAAGLAPVMNISAAGLDRAGQAERLGNANGRCAIGMEELRVHHIERRFGMKPAGEGQHGAGYGAGIETRANGGDQGEPWPQHGHPAAIFHRWQRGQRAIAMVAR